MKYKYLHLVVIAPVVVVVDQWTKHWAVDTLMRRLDPIRVIDGLFHLKYVENRGAAWGLMQNLGDTFRVPFFIGVSIIAIAFILALYRKLQASQRMLAIALSLVLGGAVGNFIDRLRFNYVVDFIDWHVKGHHWPTFNIADAAITVGVALLLLDVLLAGRAERTASRAAANPPAPGAR